MRAISGPCADLIRIILAVRFAAAFVSILLALPASAAVLFNNNVLSGDATGANTADLQSRLAAGEDITLATGATVRAVTFIGAYFPGNAPAASNPNPDDFVLRIFDYSTGTPGAEVGVSRLTGTRTFIPGPNSWSYEMNLDTPIPLTGLDYAVFIQNDTSCDTSYQWAYSMDVAPLTLPPSPDRALTANTDAAGVVTSFNVTGAERPLVLQDDVFVATPDARGCSNTGPGGDADLGVDIDGPTSILAQSFFMYDATVSNFGPDTATGVDLVITLPANVTYYSATPGDANCTGMSIPGATVTCAIGSLNNGGSKVVELTVLASNSPGSATANATVSGDQEEATNTASNTDAVVTAIDPQLVGVQDSIGEAFDRQMNFGDVVVGDVVTETITVTNEGIQPAMVEITSLPAAPFTVLNPGDCDNVTLDDDEFCVLTIEFAPAAIGTTSSEIAFTFDLGGSTVQLSGAGVNAMANLSISKDADPVTVTPGSSGMDLTEFTLTVTNDGPAAAPVLVTDVLPAGFSLVGAPPMNYDPMTGVWDVGDMAPNTSAVLLLPTQVSAGAGCVTNTATAVIAPGVFVSDPQSAGNSDSIAVGLGGNCTDLALALSITDNAFTVALDTTETALKVDFLVTITNEGDAPAENIELQGIMAITRVDDGTDYPVQGASGSRYARPLAIDPQRSGMSCDRIALLCTVDRIEAGESVTIIYRVKYSVSLQPDTEIAYSFNLTSDAFELIEANNQIVGAVIAIGTDSNGGSGSTGCFIATAAYGSYLEPEVMLLRQFRDRWLVTNAPGRALVNFYYANSPPLANVIAQSESLRAVSRWMLTPLVYTIKYPLWWAPLLLLGFAWLIRGRLRAF